ncbi:MAG: NTP/NDP exchange transporter [Pseudomonadota bacterium]
MGTSYITELRRTFWPIESRELKKFLPLAAMMFFILFNYSMLRSIKDGFVVTDIGPEAIGFLKIYVVLPMAIVAMVVYAKLCNALSPQAVFYAVSGFFVTYLVFFTFVLYPNPTLWHPDASTIETLAANFPNFKWFIRIAGSWGTATFYTMSELWGSMMLSLLFWQFANQITKTEEAKRFYSMFGLLGNFSLPLTSLVLGSFLGEHAIGHFDLKFTPVLIISICSGVIVVLIYKYINDNVLTDPLLYNAESKSSKKKKAKLSLGESFKLIFSSKYLGLIAILVLAYGISVNLVEGIWKSKIRELYPTREAYTAYMGEFQGWMGLGSIIFMIIGSNILRRVQWCTAAMLTPIMMLITGLAFFCFIFFGDDLSRHLIGILSFPPLVAAVTIGMIQNVLSKATKYSLFDSTKEMAYIPLEDELKSKGKAAVDVVGGRLGKSGGGLIQSTFFILLPSFSFVEATPYFAGVFFIIVILWIYGVRALSHEYQNATKDHSY